MIKLVVTNKNTNDQKVYQLSQNTIVFGRAANCDVVLDSSTVSRRHMQIIVHRNLLEIEDLGSGNGTIVNQDRIASKERVPLKKGDQIQIEEFTIDFESDMPSVPRTSNNDNKFETTDPDILEIKMIKKILGAFDNDKRPTLIVVSTPHQNLRAHIDEDKGEFIVGRDEQCQLSIDSQTVSRKHAKITHKWGGFVITDLESKNGTFVNGEQITEKAIRDGDEIVFGTIKTVFKNPQEFDIDAISRSIKGEEEPPIPVSTAPVFTAANTPTVSAEAKASLTPDDIAVEKQQPSEVAAKPQPEEPKKEEVPEEKPAPENAEEANPSETEGADKTDQIQPKKKVFNPLASFSTTEYALFGFGILVMILVITMLMMLLK